MSKIIGIDLGTTNSCVAVLEGGQPTVIVNAEGVDNLTTKQVADIFSGKITNWKDVGGYDKSIQVIIREDGSGTRECFDKAMTTVDSSWSAISGAVSCSSTGLVIKQVQDTEGSIGYISIGQGFRRTWSPCPWRAFRCRMFPYRHWSLLLRIRQPGRKRS